jgi:hypothetical protein
MIYGFKELRQADDWRPIVGDRNWVPLHSAYELAHKWHGGGFPPAVQASLANVPFEVLRTLTINYCFVEKPVFLDSYAAPSCTDIMVYCSNGANDRVIIGVEGKALEEFGPRIHLWIEGNGTSRSGRVRRLKFLNEALGIQIPPHSPLRYQLLHRTVSVLMECALHGAMACVVLVHSFAPETAAQQPNWNDYATFVQLLGVPVPQPDTIQGPVLLGPGLDLQTFFLWISDNPI